MKDIQINLGLVILKSLSIYNSKDRVVLYSKDGYDFTLGYLNKTATFDDAQGFLIMSEQDSIQIRPKAIYKNDKGYYVKTDNKKRYLSSEEVETTEIIIGAMKPRLEAIINE